MFPTEGRGAEFLILAALALIVVGPKELPGLLRKLGQFIGKMRSIANDFRTSFDEMARQSELDDLRKQVEEMRLQTERATAMPHVDQEFEDFKASLNPPDPTPDWGAQPAVETGSSGVAKPKRAKAASPKVQMVSPKPAPSASKRAPADPAAKPAASKPVAAKTPAKAPVKPRRRAPANSAS